MIAVTAAVSPLRIVCANTLGAALRQAEHGVNAQRTFRFRHTGNRQAKFAEARQVLGMTINYQKQFKALADRMAREPIAGWVLERRVLRHLWTIALDELLGGPAHVAVTLIGSWDPAEHALGPAPASAEDAARLVREY